MMSSETYHALSPDELMRQALVEVLGENNVRQILLKENANGAFSLTYWLAIFDRVRARYGPLTADGILFLLGRAFFSGWLRGRAACLLFANWQYRLLPLNERIAATLDGLCQDFSSWLGSDCHLQPQPGQINLQVAAPASSASFWQGMVAAAAAWTSGDKVYPVDVVEPVSAETCHLLLSLKPVTE